LLSHARRDWSAAEVEITVADYFEMLGKVSRAEPAQYHLYRVFRFRADPKLFMVQGSLEQVCRLDAVQFRARVK
jgi:hypothetical protein